MLVERGILVKVNSVMIPGINDEHLKEVSRIVKSKGAFLHNVMPLIAEAEHGTFFGVMGQRGPSPDELMDLQESCSGDMNMMRHCRQCRADAVGLLGEDRGAEFTLDKIDAMEIDYQAAMVLRKQVQDGILAHMEEKRGDQAAKPSLGIPAGTRPVLMAVATSGQGLINQHFGHAKEFQIYQTSSEGVKFMSHRKTDQYCSGDRTCGDAESALARTISGLEGCEVVLCSKIGYEPWGMLEEAGIQPNGEHAMEDIEEAVMAVYREMLRNGQLQQARQTVKRATA
jgi:nitrogen fixation protein NifB